MAEQKRHLMMQNLFGDQSEEEDIDSEHQSNIQAHDAYDEVDAEMESNIEPDEADAEMGSNMEPDEDDLLDRNEVNERYNAMGGGDKDDHMSQGVNIGNQHKENEVNEDYSDQDEEDGQQDSESDNLAKSSSTASKEHPQSRDEDDQPKNISNSTSEEDNADVPASAAEIRDVFGDSDDEEPGYPTGIDIDQKSPVEEDKYESNIMPEDIVADEDVQYDFEEKLDEKPKERPTGPPLLIEMPFCKPPAEPAKMNMVKVSNIMGFDPNPFDPKTYVEEKAFVTDDSGLKKRIRLENNIVRWRTVKNPDGTTSVESNARFVRWSDGSLQLLIGNEVLDISLQDAHHDQMHLFLRHEKSLLQSQGRLLKKMRFLPSSLSSNSHRLLTALVDSRHRKVYKVKNCITDIDPEKVKEEQTKFESQMIRASVHLNKKKEKVSRKYPQTMERRRQLSPGFLEEALDEEEEQNLYSESRSRHFGEELELEMHAEKRILSAKKGRAEVLHEEVGPSVMPLKRTASFTESEREESEYETEEEAAISPDHQGVEEPEIEEEGNEEQEEHLQEEHDQPMPEDPPQEYEAEVKEPELDAKAESEEESPPRKAPAHRRMAIIYDSDEE